MKKLNVAKTRELDLCLSCEICSAVCPPEAITMENRLGQFLPKIDDGKCTRCGLCLEVCPGIDVDPSGLRFNKVVEVASFDGPYLASYTAFSNDTHIRKNSASGGMITTLATGLIKNKEFDTVFVLPFYKFDGRPARLEAASEVDKIWRSAKSKYVPASVFEIIKTLKRREDKKYIIVGTPCQIDGIKKYLRRSKRTEANLLFLGLFCEKTLNFNVIRYFEDNYKRPGEKLIKFEFKSKERHGWPGHSKLYFDSGRELMVDRGVRMQLKSFFQLNRCLFCLDKLNRAADISFGDCYVSGKGDFHGKSSVIVRTEKGREIFDKYSHLFTLEEEKIGELRRSQGLAEKKENLEYVRSLIKEHNLYPEGSLDYRINEQAMKRLRRLQEYIGWGENYSVNKIKLALLVLKATRKLKTTGGKVALAGILGAEGFFIHMRNGNKNVQEEVKRGNIVIVGGEFFNKGSQAMVFTVVDQIRRRLPDKDYYLLSTGDYEREESEKNIYRMGILPWDLRTRVRLLGFWSRFIPRGRFGDVEDKVREVIKGADFIVDISGYALSSQFNVFSSLCYLLNILIAKKYSVPYYILPQSIGPFDYPLKHKWFLDPLLKCYLKYPTKIFPREREGLRFVSSVTKKNVEKSCDLVLQNKGYNLSNIYKGEVCLKDIKIAPNSVGVIPSYRVIERVGSDKIYSIYSLLVNKLLSADKTVYLLMHSQQDVEVFRKIKGLFADNERIKVISDDLNAIELENVIKQFDFIISSRYHAIVQAYKNCVPSLVIGWATKYFELLKDFEQLDYFLDCRNGTNFATIDSKLDKIIRGYRYEREKIKSKMATVVDKSVFDVFGKLAV